MAVITKNEHNICGSVHRAFVVKIIPTRCNNCVLFFAYAFTLHVSGDNSTHHQEYMCCIWPQVSRHSVPAYLWPYTAHVLLMMGGIVTRNM